MRGELGFVAVCLAHLFVKHLDQGSAAINVRLPRRGGGANMHRYRNLSGNSGVEAFELVRDGIVVRFRGGATYLYDYAVPGRAAVERMKRLADEGRGLSTYITRFVGDKYAAKID